MKKLIILAITFLSIVGCSKGGDERIAEQENIRSREQINAQNENNQEWADKMEKDLNKRKYFIKSIEGTFRGDLAVEGIDFVIKAMISPSIPISFSDRIRTLQEINYELENMAINLHIKLENPRVSNSAVSCTIEGYKPDVDKGMINIISESCKNIFKLLLSDDLNQFNREILYRDASNLAKDVKQNNISQVDILSGFFESSVSTKEYQFKLQRN
jgi:hypothetical protein